MNRAALLQRLLVLLTLLTASALATTDAQARERRFEPNPRSEAQVVQVQNGAAIISAAGQHFSTGASMAPESARKVWLSVSIKNTGAAPVELVDGVIQITNAGEPLRLQEVSELANDGQENTYFRDHCAYASSSSQINCNSGSFNRRQRERLEAERSSKTRNATRELALGELVVERFQVDLPKRNRSSPTVLTVMVTAGGEQIAFDFKEVD